MEPQCGEPPSGAAENSEVRAPRAPGPDGGRTGPDAVNGGNGESSGASGVSLFPTECWGPGPYGSSRKSTFSVPHGKMRVLRPPVLEEAHLGIQQNKSRASAQSLCPTAGLGLAQRQASCGALVRCVWFAWLWATRGDAGAWEP